MRGRVDLFDVEDPVLAGTATTVAAVAAGPGTPRSTRCSTSNSILRLRTDGEIFASITASECSSSCGSAPYMAWTARKRCTLVSPCVRNSEVATELASLRFRFPAAASSSTSLGPVTPSARVPGVIVMEAMNTAMSLSRVSRRG